jgi:hypothetical protein
MQGVSSSRKSKVRQRKPLTVLVARCKKENRFRASEDTPTLGLARHTLRQRE